MKIQFIYLIISLLLIACKGPDAKQSKHDFKSSNIEMQKMIGQSHLAQAGADKADISLEPCEGCVTITDLIKNKKSYSSKTVRVKGIVTKVNPGIMGKNWVHIQDGTQYDEIFDLTVTTVSDSQPGDTVTIEGRIELDKDFGYGYKYSILMEDGEIVK